jgi:Family of unknown function (DUF6461)
VAVVDGSGEAEVIRAYGGEPHRSAGALPFDAVLNLVPEEDLGKYSFAQTLVHAGHVVVIENNGWAGKDTELAQRASHGGRFVSVYWSPTGTRVVEAIGGTLTADFDPLYTTDDAAEPPAGETYPEWLNDVSFPMDHLQAAMLDALEQRTGVAFERDWLSLQLETYRVGPSATEDS